MIVEGVDAGGGFRGGSDGGLLIDREQPKHGRGPNATLRLRELWDVGSVNEISMLPNVKGVTSIGCVLAVEVDDGGGGGYSSGAAKEIVLKLRAHSIYSRMAPLTTTSRL